MIETLRNKFGAIIGSASKLSVEDLKTKNFEWTEWTDSVTGRNHKIDNMPNQNQLACLMITSRKMQMIRDEVGKIIDVSSGFRSRELNKLVGGSPDSLHMQGLACDSLIRGLSPKQTAKIYAKVCQNNKISFDKILIENGCVHIQFAAREKDNRNLIGFAKKIKGEWEVRYVKSSTLIKKDL